MWRTSSMSGTCNGSASTQLIGQAGPPLLLFAGASLGSSLLAQCHSLNRIPGADSSVCTDSNHWMPSSRRAVLRSLSSRASAEAEEMTCEDLDNRQYPPSIKVAQVGQQVAHLDVMG